MLTNFLSCFLLVCCSVCHASTVKRIAWRWRAESEANAPQSQLEMATCSEDHTVRIFALPASMLYAAAQA